MKKIIKTFGENLERLEIAKLRVKYEELGYVFSEEVKKQRGDKKFLFDAYAQHPETNDEIIFEVKSVSSIRQGDTDRIIKHREEYFRFFPKARFIIVIARERKEPQIIKSDLDSLLLDLINKKYLSILKQKINRINKLEFVENITFSKVELGNFRTIELTGIGNLRFRIHIKDSGLFGEALSDGIPFKFSVELNHLPSNQERIYELSGKSQITFDLSEFEL